MHISSKQIKMARILLDWTQAYLAERSKVSKDTIINFETERSLPKQTTVDKIVGALRDGGVSFTEDNGVKEQQTYIKRYRGVDGFKAFMDHVYEVAKDVGGEICLYNARPANWIKWLGTEWNAMHSARMAELVDTINFKATAQRGDVQLIGYKHAEYRWIPEEMWNERSFYAYGDYIGFLIFEEESVSIFVLKEAEVAASFRSLFNITWDHVAIIPDTTDLYKPPAK